MAEVERFEVCGTWRHHDLGEREPPGTRNRARTPRQDARSDLNWGTGWLARFRSKPYRLSPIETMETDPDGALSSSLARR